MGLFVLSVFTSGFFNDIWSVIFICFILLAALCVNFNKISVKQITIYALLFILGSTYYLGVNFYISNKYSSIYEKDKELTITVVSEPEQNDKYISFTGKIEEYDGVRASVSLMNENKNIEYYDVIKVKGTISSFKEAIDLYSFDSKYYNYSNRIYLKVTSTDKFEIIDSKTNFMTKVNGVKKKISYILSMNFSYENSILLKGILIGEKDKESDELNNALIKTGLSHIVVVSGMHFSIINMLIITLLRRFMVKRKISSLISIPVSVLLAIFVGFSASVVRALIMLTILNVADIVNRERKTDGYTIVITAFIMILFNPYIIHNPGFVLSFSSVGGIILFNEKIRSKLGFIPELIKDIISASLAANITTLPFVIYYFNGMPILFIFSNVIISLFIPFIMVYGVIIIIFSYVNLKLGWYLCIPLNYFLNCIVYTIMWMSELPYGYITTFAIEKYLIVVYLFGIYVINNIKKQFLRNILIIFTVSIFTLSMFINNIGTYIFNYCELYAFCGKDSGKVLISYRDKDILIDLSTENKNSYSSLVEAKCKGKVDVLIASNAFNINTAEKNNLYGKAVYYPVSVTGNEYCMNIIRNRFDNSVSLNKEFNLKYDDIYLTLELNKSYNISKVIIEFKERKIVVTNDFNILINDENRYIVSSKILKRYNNENILNRKNEGIERIKI